MTDSEADFQARWQRLTTAARAAAEAPPEALSAPRLAAILARRRLTPPRRPLVIGWFPPGLAAAALVALALQAATGLDPLATLDRTGDFLRDLPSAVPHAPSFVPPVTVPRAADAVQWTSSVTSTLMPSLPSLPPAFQESRP